MPSDANGVYSLPSGYLAVTGETIQASQHNPPLEDLASSMSARLMRTGVAPMTGPLKITDGAVGSPAIQFNSNGSTGFYKTPNGIGVSVGGTNVAEFTSSGASRMLGELIPWTLLAAPSGWVLPYGQTLSRTTYAALWEVAQDEIAGGNVFFNNGDGSTTFGIGDLRGRGVAGKDDMGGTAAGRLTSSISGSAIVIGGTGGSESRTLAQTNLPAISLSLNGTPASIAVDSDTSGVIVGTTNLFTVGSGTQTAMALTSSSSGARQLHSTGTFTPQGTVGPLGSGTSFFLMQPTMVCNFLLYAGA